MFIVNSLSEGVARGGLQTCYDTEYTVSAAPRQIAVYTDWYVVAAGKVDWGYIVSKIGLSFANWVQGAALKAMASVITTDAEKWGIGGYMANGMSDENWIITARNVQLANGGSQVFALGTKLALADVLPAESATSGFRYGENSAIIKKGFLPSYKEVPLIELGQALSPNTINGVPEVVVPDDVIYMLPVGMDKPVHVVVEGNSISVAKNPFETKDHSYQFIVTAHLGVDVVVGSKFGAITLA